MSDNSLSIGSIQVGIGDTRATSSGMRIPSGGENSCGGIHRQADLLQQVARLLNSQKATGLRYSKEILQQTEQNPFDIALSAGVNPVIIKEAFEKFKKESTSFYGHGNPGDHSTITQGRAQGLHQAEMVLQAQNALMQYKESGKISINYGEFFLEAEAL